MYGKLPISLGQINVECKEMMFYQYLPIKLLKQDTTIYEHRLDCFTEIIKTCCEDYIKEFGLESFINSYIYVTAKYLYKMANCSFNRMGWHSDGFLTEDINYIWCDKFPTVFNTSNFQLTLDDVISIREMDNQALASNDMYFKENTLLRLNQYNIHRVNPTSNEGMRAFLKVSFSKDKYDLIGNSHNYFLDYDWEMKPRSPQRNIPQSKISFI